MIPQAYLQEWSVKAPWPDLRQVEQDLVICRALCDLFNAPALAGKIAFRGGTAIASFEPEELFGTKLRALLQRRKGRNLFDLNEGLKQLALNPQKLVACIKGDAWKLTDKVIEEFRQKKYPSLLKREWAGKD